MMNPLKVLCLLLILNPLLSFAMVNSIPADESGYEAWLRYNDKGERYGYESYQSLLKLYTVAEGACVPSAISEWARALEGFSGQSVEQVGSI
ncbi:MAG: hypothetical protein CUN55_21525, partial [Phototrophicales bacterium]